MKRSELQISIPIEDGSYIQCLTRSEHEFLRVMRHGSRDEIMAELKKVLERVEETR